MNSSLPKARTSLKVPARAILLLPVVFFACFSAAPLAAQSVSLAWDPNRESRLAGYNVYRSDDPDNFTSPPLNGPLPVKETSFRDSTAEDNRVYYYGITAVDLTGGESSKSNIVRVATGSPANRPPIVSIDTVQTVTLPAPAQLTATAVDDGLPRGQLTYEWSVVSGATGATIASPQSASTQVTFTKAGTYTLRVSVSDGEFTSTSDVNVNVESSLTTGFIRVPPPPDRPSVGLGLVDYQQNQALISETVFQGAPAIRNGRLYAPMRGSLKTGLAVANTTSDTVTIDFYFSNQTGGTLYSGQFSLPGYEQIVAFLDEAPFSQTPSSLDSAQTFTFSASGPVAVAALQTLTNDRSEFLMTSLPVAELKTSGAGDVVSIPQFIDGGGWQSEIQLVNTTDSNMSGKIHFFPALRDTPNDTAYDIPPRGAFVLRTPGGAADQQTGWIQITPDSGKPSPAGSVMLINQTNGITNSLGNVRAMPGASSLGIYAETSGTNQGQPASVETGLTIANPSWIPVGLDLELLADDWSSTGHHASLTVGAHDSVSLLLDQITGLSDFSKSFKGIIRIQGSVVLASGFKRTYRTSDSVITPIPALIQNSSPDSTYLFFVEGSGYTTQLIDLDPSSLLSPITQNNFEALRR